MLAHLLLALLAAGGPSRAPATPLPGDPKAGNCQGTHHPGDTIVCYIVFRGDPDFTSLSLSFNADPVQDPGELPIAFNLDKSRKVAPGVYEVTDILPFATSGRCYLFSIMASVGPGAYRDYIYGRQFFSRIAIHFTADEPEPAGDWHAEQKAPDLEIPGKNGDTPPEQPKLEIPGEPNKLVTIEKSAPAQAQTVPESKKTKKQKKRNVAELREVGPEPRGPSPDLFPKFRSLQGKNHKRPCEGGNKPGDRITCYVGFDGESAFTRIYLSFYNRDAQYEQSGLCNSLFFQDWQKVGRRKYRVTGILPACADGNYTLSGMQVWTLTGLRDYREGIDFINRFPAIHLDNRNQTALPDIVSIGPFPPSRD